MGHRAYHRAIDGKQYPPEVIQAWILNKLRCDAMQQIGPFDKAVITVPAYFDEVRRKATQDAGYMAGCEVLDIINEPTAAAVAFGFQQGFLNAAGSSDRPRRVLVYDLGGGTFDVTVMEIRGSEFLALATDGDVALGGYDWDQRLLNLAADAFQREHGLDLRDNAAAAGKLWRECEDAKRTLSARPKAPVVAEYQGKTHPPGNLPRAVRRSDAGPPGPHPLHLRAGPAGGGPGVVRSRPRAAGGRFHPHADGPRNVAEDQRQAARRLGGGRRSGGPRRGPACRLDPGQARRPGGEFQHPQRQLAQPGRGGHRPADQAPPQRHRHSPQHALPVSATRQFRTAKHDQRSILVQIVEGESPSADDCTPIGRCTVADLPPGLPARSPVDVIFNYQSDGRLKVRVQVPHRPTGSWKPRLSARTA